MVTNDETIRMNEKAMSDLPVVLLLPNLPTMVLYEIFDFLTLSEQYQFSGLCQSLRNFQIGCYNATQSQLDLDFESTLLASSSSSSSSTLPLLLSEQQQRHDDFLLVESLWKSYITLQELNLGIHTTDSCLAIFSQQWNTSSTPTSSCLPQLTSLKMRKSNITDTGLLFLSQSSLMKTLQYIDITYCRQTTYRGTLPLRQECSNLKVLRRQPSWMDGKYQTPFAAHGEEVEVHTYWPDGSFQFSRAAQSSGYVCDLKELADNNNDNNNNNNCNNEQQQQQQPQGDNNNTMDGNFVCDKLQYNNFIPPGGWPQWAKTCYRPGVSLLRLEDEIQKGSCTANNNNNRETSVISSVLVAQKLRGLRPPTKIRRLLEQVKDLVPLGESRYYSSTGKWIPEERLEEERRLDNIMLISRMRLIPFENEQERIPPKDLVALNMQVYNRIRSNGNGLVDPAASDYFEEVLHLHLGGNLLPDE